MKKKTIWLVFLISLFSLTYGIHELGERGALPHPLLHRWFFGSLQRASAKFTDLKFWLRGNTTPKNPIVIVEIDSASLEEIGRWPWRRDYVALLIDELFRLGARVVATDILFSEEQRLVPDEVSLILAQTKYAGLIQAFDVDQKLSNVVEKNKKGMVLAWASESPCRPALLPESDCPVTHPRALASLPKQFDKFAFKKIKGGAISPKNTPIMSAVTVIPNIPPLSQATNYAGFVNEFRDKDGMTRRMSLAMIVNGRPYPSFALQIASAARQALPSIELTSGHKIQRIQFANRDLSSSSLGVGKLNYHGPSRTFPYISARDIFREGDVLEDDVNRRLSGQKKQDILKDALVLVGVSALAVSDVAATPYDPYMPGVEVQATFADNVLSGELLRDGSHGYGTWILLFLMTVGAAFFAIKLSRMTDQSAVVFSLVTIGTLGWIDWQLFSNHYDWNTGFLYLELIGLIIATLVYRYMEEEKQRRFLKTAFSKYVAPSVVDSVIKDPKQLTVGGKKSELTVLFSDIRNFTAFSETADPKQLSDFLNDYLTLMTSLIFETQGTLDKYMGDGIMAFWGAPLPQKDHAQRACRTALAMQRELATNRARLKDKYGCDVHIGIGIHTGTVTVGNMGSNRSFDYTVIGDGVNLASRLESATKSYRAGILVSQETLEEIQRSTAAEVPRHRRLSRAHLKGKQKHVEVAELLSGDYSAEALNSFEEGLRLFEQRRWEEARAHFSKLNEVEDPVVTAYLDRCERLKQTPPPEDWDGSWDLSESK